MAGVRMPYSVVSPHERAARISLGLDRPGARVGQMFKFSLEVERQGRGRNQVRSCNAVGSTPYRLAGEQMQRPTVICFEREMNQFHFQSGRLRN